MTSILDQYEKASKQVIVLNFKGRWIESGMTFSLHKYSGRDDRIYQHTAREWTTHVRQAESRLRASISRSSYVRSIRPCNARAGQ